MYKEKLDSYLGNSPGHYLVNLWIFKNICIKAREMTQKVKLQARRLEFDPWTLSKCGKK